MNIAVAVDRQGPFGHDPSASVVITVVTEAGSMLDACAMVARVALAVEQGGAVTIMDTGDHAMIVTEAVRRELAPYASALRVKGPDRRLG